MLAEQKEISIAERLDKMLAKGAYGFATAALEQGILG
jgi:hypothetical protein